MSTTIENLKIPYPTEGVIRSSSLNDTVAPENSVQLAVNFNFDRVGSFQTRPGVATLYTSRSGSITSFGTLNIQGGTKALFSQVGTDISVWNGSSWSSVRTLSSSQKARFSQYLNRVWMVNGTGAGGDAPATSNGGAFGSTDVPATFPKADFIQAGFDGRVWIADKSKDVVYYTDIVQFNGTTYTSPLTFDLTTNFIQTFSPQDGESISGLFRVPRALLLFKQNHIYRIYNASNVDPYPAYNVGTYSQESIVQAKDGIYFHHSSGFYKFNYDGQPTEISKRIGDVVRAIPRSYYENVTGIYDGYDAVKWSVGPVTVEGVSYENMQVRYTISTQVWTIYDFPDNSITAMIPYDDGTYQYQVMGTSTGKVGQMDSGNTDFGDDIYFDFIDRWRSYTKMYADVKSFSGINVLSNNGGGAKLQYQIQQSGPNEWNDIDTLDGQYSSLFPNASSDDFNIARFRINGQTSGAQIVFDGIEILTLQDKGLDKN